MIAAELPNNQGTSVTNIAEGLAWKVAHDPAIWAQAPKAPLEGLTWIEYYPEDREAKAAHGIGKHTSMFDEHFSLVTFTYTPESEEPEAEGEPDWERLPRKRVEQMIGQPFAPIEAAAE